MKTMSGQCENKYFYSMSVIFMEEVIRGVDISHEFRELQYLSCYYHTTTTIYFELSAKTWMRR